MSEEMKESLKHVKVEFGKPMTKEEFEAYKKRRAAAGHAAPPVKKVSLDDLSDSNLNSKSKDLQDALKEKLDSLRKMRHL